MMTLDISHLTFFEAFLVALLAFLDFVILLFFAAFVQVFIFGGKE
jgi:hypothetical protein